MFGVNEFDFLLSVCGNANFIEFISNAKSGQFFFYSSDGKYMIKTMTNNESKFLRRSKSIECMSLAALFCAILSLFLIIIPPPPPPTTSTSSLFPALRQESKHFVDEVSWNVPRENVPLAKECKVCHHEQCVLHRCGHGVTFCSANERSVCPQLLFPCFNCFEDKHLQSFYDLKGSVLGREAKPHQDVKKDNDLRNGMPDSAIALPSEIRERMRRQIVADCEFMESMEIMDYSMLVGIHHIPPAEERTQASDSIARTGFSIGSRRRDSLRDLMQRKRLHSTSSVEKGAAMDSDMVSPQRGKARSSANSSVSSSGSKTIPHENRQRTQLDEHLSALQLYEHGYDEEDDNSYLEGSEEFKRVHNRALANTGRSSLKHVESCGSKLEDIERKKLQTVEQIYWPFHRYYDINGLRRMVPAQCSVCNKVDCSCEKSSEFLAGLKIPSFEPPLSSRKDGGLMMDTTGFDLPMKVTFHGNEQLCDGKIFYMGIIDILQQYNIRKRFEARYRQLRSRGWEDASCVHPRIYADRFVRFFDEYSQRHDVPSHGTTQEQLSLGEGEEQIVFEKQIPLTNSRSSIKITGSASSNDIEISHLKEE